LQTASPPGLEVLSGRPHASLFEDGGERMLGKVQKMTEPPRDELRIALAESILDRDAKAKATELAREAVERSNELVADAERHEDAVKIALTSAREGREARLREAVESGSVIEKPPPSSQARFALDDAAAELEIARKVLATSTASLAFAVDAQQWAQRKVEAAAAPVLAGEIDRLIVEAVSLQAALDDKHATLLWLRGVLPPVEEYQRIGRALPPPPPPGVKARDYRPPAEWVAAREALLVDADALLPS
jgi:hypothetical protein